MLANQRRRIGADAVPVSLRQKAIQGVAWTAVQNWGTSLFSTLVFLVLANQLDPASFGLVAYAAVFIAFLSIFQRQGFAQALVQCADVEPAHLNTAFWISTASGVVLALVMFGCSSAIARWYGEPELGGVLRWLSLTLVVDALGNVPRAILQRRLAFKALAFRNIIATLIGGTVGVSMAVSGYGVWSLVGLQIATSSTGVVAVWLVCRWRPGWSMSRKHLRQLVSFGAFTMGQETLGFLNRRTADLLIGTFLGPTALGYYHVGFRLLLVMTRMFTSTFSVVMFPTFSRLQHDHSQLRNAYLTSVRMASFVSFPAFLGMAVVAPQLVHALFGEQWNPAIPVMQILSLIGLVQTATFFSGPMIMACGKPSWTFGLSMANTAANVLAFTIALPWGIVAVAIAFVVRGFVYAPFPVFLVRKLIGLDIGDYLREHTAPLAASLAMVGVVWTTRTLIGGGLTEGALLVVLVMIGAVTYAGSILVIAPQRVRQALDFARTAIGRPSRPSDAG